jgi:hypothetical protein
MSNDEQEDGPHRWEIEPSNDKEFDSYCTNSDLEALDVICEVAEQIWDGMPEDEGIVCKSIRITFNPRVSTKGEEK